MVAARRPSQIRVLQALELPADWEMRPGVPATRGGCSDVPRPCPHVECRHHLWLRLQQEQPGNPQRGRQGTTTFRPTTMESCSLDVADRGPQSYDAIGELLDVDPTRVSQIEKRALMKLRARDVDELLGGSHHELNLDYDKLLAAPVDVLLSELLDE